MYTFTGTTWGYDLNLGGAIVTAPNGNIYVFLDDAALDITVWKSTNGGTSFTELAKTTRTSVHGGTAYIYNVHAAMDDDGYVHVVSYPSQKDTRDIAYCLFNTADDSWGTWEEAAGLNNIASDWAVRVSLDSNGKPHIIYCDSYKVGGDWYDRVYYTNKTGVSWLAPEMVSTDTGMTYIRPMLTLRGGDVVEAFYVGDIYAEDTVYRRSRSGGSWGAETAWSTLYLALERCHLLCNASGTVYGYADDSGSPLYENDAIASAINIYSAHPLALDASLYNDVRYVFYIDNVSRYVKYIKNNGSGWTSPATLQTADAYKQVIAEWAYNFEYQSARVNYLFSDGVNYLHFDYLDFSTPITDSQPAFLKAPDIVTDNQSAFLEGTTIPPWSVLLDTEEGNLSEWTTTGAYFSATNVNPLYGNFSVLYSAPAGASYSFIQYYNTQLAGNSGYAYARFLFQAATFTGTSSLFARISTKVSPPHTLIDISLNPTYYQCQVITDSGGAFNSAQIAWTSTDLHIIEMYIKRATSTTSNDAIGRFWVDGNLVWEKINFDQFDLWSDIASEHRLRIDGTPVASSVTVFRFDEVLLNNTGDRSLVNSSADSQSAFLKCGTVGRVYGPALQMP